MVLTRSMVRNSDDWIQEREELRRKREEQRTRLELYEARTKRLEEALVALTERHRIPNWHDEGSGIGGESENHEQRGREKWRKLEIPIFSGDDAFGWTQRLERYFLLKDVTETERMQATLVALEGKALCWYQWWSRCTPNPTWEGFKLVVVRRFQPSMVQNPLEQLLALKQLGTVEEYVEEFEKFVGALREIDQEFVRGIFLNGLKEEIKAEVKLHEHHTLSEVIQKSIMIEEKNLILQKKIIPNNYSRPLNFVRNNFPSKSVTVETKTGWDKRAESSSVGSGPTNSGHMQAADSNRSRGGEFKHLTGAEMREKREKRLCFRCDEPYSREHRCKNKQFRMIILEEDEEEEEENNDEPLVGNFHSLQLSLCSMAGLTSTKSSKIKGLLKDRIVIILIDCGASHNFIASNLVNNMKLEVLDSPSYIVEVGDGHKVRCMGEVKADFGKLELTIKQGPNVHRLIGDPALSKSELTFGAFMQVFKKEGEGLILQCIGQTSSSQQPLQVPEAVDNLLSEFSEVFADLQDLPPQRKQDHAIHLKEGAEIPNLRPYKKKDGGWRFCVDYRALNKIIILNKFPIPIIEELLDEIGGATIFTKLDLKSGYHQIRMHEGDIEKTAFRTHEGHYEFVVMPFGLTNAPSTFQSLMNEVLRSFLRKFVLVFFDDILIYSKDMLSHVAHLQQVLQVLQTNSLKANKKKCSFGQESLEYLGHVISGQGVAADKSKVDAINSWPLPKEIKGLRGFLGLTGYYRRFVQGYGKLAKPLIDLLKKDNFKWTEEKNVTFVKGTSTRL
ncbi:PREDICTED: uncharacterized protein LOC109350506 [Lupinus angustifolius]|uniref:uncharacterized protein LOC109350506 n=1 Tax=Lupinus angustifolius TaxID=3871 RepID=UPI00092E6A16|nr:PREDICTED: uncharacterized protein LOC109350506 [Lupinus angustifolius]